MKNLFALSFVLLCFVSCGKSVNDSMTPPEEPQKTFADYQGVWENVDNDTAFVAISPTGFVSYYLRIK